MTYTEIGNALVSRMAPVTHEQGYCEDVGESLLAIDGVEQVCYTMGDIDVVVVSRV